MADTLLTNTLNHFWDCCRIYQDHKENEPRPPAGERDDFQVDWLNYERRHRTWAFNKLAHEEVMSCAARLLSDSSFDENEKVEIAGRLVLLESDHGNDEVVMSYIAKIREQQILAQPATTEANLYPDLDDDIVNEG